LQIFERFKRLTSGGGEGSREGGPGKASHSKRGKRHKGHIESGPKKGIRRNLDAKSEVGDEGCRKKPRKQKSPHRIRERGASRANNPCRLNSHIEEGLRTPQGMNGERA